MARLSLIVGLPGAGKTTTAKRLAAEQHALRLTPDEWMIPLLGESNPAGKRAVLEGRLIALARQALELGTNVVLDFGFWSRDERSSLRWLATQHDASCKVIYLPIGRHEQLARIGQRQLGAPHTTFVMTESEVDGWREQFEPPDSAELAGLAIPAPPPGWLDWSAWTADRWPSSDR